MYIFVCSYKSAKIKPNIFCFFFITVYTWLKGRIQTYDIIYRYTIYTSFNLKKKNRILSRHMLYTINYFNYFVHTVSWNIINKDVTNDDNFTDCRLKKTYESEMRVQYVYSLKNHTLASIHLSLVPAYYRFAWQSRALWSISTIYRIVYHSETAPRIWCPLIKPENGGSFIVLPVVVASITK